MILLGLSGYARSGKDSVANFLVKHHNFERVAFADALKDLLYDVDPILASWNGALIDGRTNVRLKELVRTQGWEEAKTLQETRELLQRIGVAARDHIHPDVWVDAAMRKTEASSRVVISDTRFPNEVDAVRDRKGHIVRITREGCEPVNGHISETAIDHVTPDFTILNDGSLDDLGYMVEDMMAYLEIP